MSYCPDIFNGARCKTYNWSQSHGDLEIRIKINKSINYEDIQVDISKREICVEVVRSPTSSFSIARNNCVLPSEILMEGKFEHPVDTDSTYWLIENNKVEKFIAIYIDKVEDMWWKKLLINEETIERGCKNYTVLMDQLDCSSRMAIDKLVNEQQQKQKINCGSSRKVVVKDENYDSPV